jgi:hypothetical protein
VDVSFWTDRAKRLIMPTIVLALFGASFISRYQRSAMLDMLGSDFLRTARAKGLSLQRADRPEDLGGGPLGTAVPAAGPGGDEVQPGELRLVRIRRQGLHRDWLQEVTSDLGHPAEPR